MQNANIGNVFTPLLASICAALALTACGGGLPEDYTKAESNSQTSAVTGLRTSSGGPDMFGNFNPAIWNESNWYECNCGRNPEASQAAVPWQAGS